MVEFLGGRSKALIKIDCAEFQHSHEIAKLTGSPPGYLGHRETHPILAQEVLNQYHTEKVKLTFLLFDEIEKASDSLWNLLLGTRYAVGQVLPHRFRTRRWQRRGFFRVECARESQPLV